MAGRQERVLSVSIFITYIILSSTIVDAVTWRRVTRPSVKQQDLPSTTQKPIAISTAKPTTKSPVIWRRSTVVRRSTDYIENEEHGDESDELNEASSEKREDLKDLENDSEVKPLVPGSRPGFWFDSSRKKKPATLLRPGTRRNSLFPTRSSTTVAPTTVSVTPVTIIPRTPPNVSSVKAKNTNTKQLFGRDKSTSSPVVFRRRLKTTRVPRISSTTESTSKESDESDEQLAEPRNDTEIEKEREDSSKDLTNNNAENDDIEYKRPKFNIRRRPYNGTRLSWTRQRIQGKRTTAVPQQLTTQADPTVTTKDYERLLRKTTQFPKTRMKSKPNATSAVSMTRTRVTAKPSASATNNKKSTAKITPESTLENDYYDEKFETEVVSSDIDSGENDFVDKPITSTRENYGLRQVSKVQPKSKVRTTVEPFFITRDYGRVVTAFAEIKTKVEDSEIGTTAVPIITKSNEYELLEDKKIVADTVKTVKKEKKRIKVKATKAPASTTTVIETVENKEKEYETENENIDSSFEYVDDFKSNFLRPTEAPTTTESNDKFSKENIIASTISTTRRPITFPTIPPMDLNSNAYVVWSVGHGGSGWSYQKHGESVKWSAQNSEAEGDNWSVEAKDVKGTKNSDFDSHWLPIRNTTINYQNNEEVNSTEKITENWEDFYPNTYVPNVPFKNETILNFNRVTDSQNLPQENTNDSFVQFNLQSNPAFSDNSSLLINNFQQPIMQQPQLNNFVSQTPLPISPTLEDQFNAQVEGIINQYPVVPDYPYVAEIRDTYKNVPTMTTKTPTTRLYDYQDYAPQNKDINYENLPVTPPSTFYEPQLIQDPQVNQYISSLKQDGIALPYNEVNEDSVQGITAVNQLSPVDLPYQKQQPNIPPELAKAVVQEKKWQVVGAGGPEGWSLLNEDGELEWKIHNVDGKWKISSAEELIKTENPVQIATYVANNQNNQVEKHGYTNDLPKVWTLEDDYEKWRAVSTERGIPFDETSKEMSLSSQEYDYESDESDSDYYSDDDDYTSEPVSKESIPYQTNDNYGSSPIWNQYEENQRIQEQRKNLPYSGNIEIANTKNDAIAAWKSLIAQQGHWKLSGNINERLSTYSRPKNDYFQNRKENVEDGVSVSSPSRGNDRPEQKFQNIKQNVEKYRNSNRYQEQRNYFANDGRPSTDESLLNLNQEKFKDSEILNYGPKNRNTPKEVHQHTSNLKYPDGYYDSLPDSTESYRNFHLTENFTTSYKQENQQTRQKNEFTDQTYALKRQDYKHDHNRNNHHAVTQHQDTRNNIAEQEFYVHNANNLQENQQTRQKNEFTDQTYALKRQDYKHDHNRNNHHALTQHQDTRNNIAEQEFYVHNANNLQENQQTRQKNEFTDQTYALKRQDYKHDHNRNNHHALTQLQDTRNNIAEQEFYVHNANNPQENEQTRQKNEFTDQTYSAKRQDNKYDHSRNNHHELTQLQETRNNIREREFYVHDANPHARDHPPKKIQNENDEIKKDPSKDSENIFESHVHAKNKDHSKLDSLISKLEAIHRESQGRAVIDLTALLTRMKEKRNFTSTASDYHSLQTGHQSQMLSPVRKVHSEQSSSNNDKDNVQEIIDKINQRETQPTKVDAYFDSKVKFLGNANDNLSHHNNDSIKYLKNESNSPIQSEITVEEHPPKNIKPQNSRLRHSMKSTRRRRRRPGSKQSKRKVSRPSINQTSVINENQYKYLAAKAPEESSYKLRSATAKAEKITEERNRNRYSKYFEGPLQNLRSNNKDTSSSEEIFMNLRDNKDIKPRDNRGQRKQPHRQNKNPHHPPPIVLKGETEIEDEEDGSKKSRKIIVIDYAGAQKKKSSVDKKDLELIIRNVKHRRSEIFDESKEDKS